jgi:hypothetical protein
LNPAGIWFFGSRAFQCLAAHPALAQVPQQQQQHFSTSPDTFVRRREQSIRLGASGARSQYTNAQLPAQIRIENG